METIGKIAGRVRDAARAIRRRPARAGGTCVLLALGIAGWLLWPMDATSYLAAEPSAELLDRAGRPLWVYLNARQQWCFEESLDRIGPLMAKATVAAEDRRFWRHPGVDPLAAARALGQLARLGRVRSGASTLTMQVVKLAGHPSRTLLGKLRQAAQALRLERHADKNAILTAYLNRAPYGLNLVGCEAAARRYFGKPARELTLAEAALLAGLPRAPTRLMPLAGNTTRTLGRRNYVLSRMRELGFISEAERERATAAPLGAAWHPYPALAPHLASRLAPLARRHTRLATTLDRETQALGEALLREHVKQYRGQIRNGALIVADAATAEVLAWVGSADFWDKARGSQVDAARARRSPGSTLKPFIYAQALEHDCLYPSEVLLDGSFDLGSYNPKNFDKRYHGLIAADAALRRSLNVPALMVLKRAGQPAVYDTLKRAGLTTLRRPAWNYGLGLALGNCEARLDELCAAYAMLAGLGSQRPLSMLRGAPAAAGRKVFSRGTALELYSMLEQPLPNELDGAALGVVNAPQRVCWKTGTSTGNHDAWAFVFNGQYVAGVWLGNPDGRSSRRLVGAEAALPLAARLFRRLKPSAAPAWPASDGDLQRVDVCALSGLPASGWCEHTRTVLMPRRLWLNRICEVHWPGGSRRGVVERWPAAARNWDLARIGPPPGEMRERTVATDGSTRALQVLSPPDSARFVLTGERTGDRIRLRSSNDGEGPVHWYLDGRFLATAQPRQPVLLELTPGRHKVVCLTPRGDTARSRIDVATPVASNPDFE